MEEKYLFHCAEISQDSLTTLLNEAEGLARKNKKVYISYCNADKGICPFNLSCSSLKCFICKTVIKKVFSKLSNSIVLIPILSKFNIDDKKRGNKYVYKTLLDIKKIVYKKSEIGFGLVSSYVSATRNIDPILNAELKNHFDAILNYESELTDVFIDLVNKIKPTTVSIFNGRLFHTRPIFDIVKSNKNIQLRVYEVVRNRNTWNIEYFEKSLPQDVVSNARRIEETWIRDQRSEEEKIEIGRSFFEKRKNGVPSGDKVYISSQIPKKLPSNIDLSKKNIVIFNSSEDEFAALGAEFDKYALFQSQIDGIRFIADFFKNSKDTHIYLRVHPNLRGVNYPFHLELYRLPEEFKNITVVSADSDISTYSLMDIASKVVVFGSSMGIESAYWGKPTILLAGSLYYNLNVCFKPKTIEELRQFLMDDNLKKENLIECVKYGHYVLDRGRLSYPANIFYFEDTPKHFKRFFCGIYKKNYFFRLYLTLLGIVFDLFSKKQRKQIKRLYK